MSLDTLIVQNLLGADRHEPSCDACALVPLGGGARTAYQVGVLKALAAMLAANSPAADNTAPAFPVQWLFATSASALNASYLASRVSLGLPALPQLADFRSQLRSSHVYRLEAPSSSVRGASW